MREPFLNLAYARAQQAQQRQIKRRRAAARRAARAGAAGAATRDAAGDDGSSLLTSPTQRMGAAHEDRALQRLIAAGLTPLARNLRCRTGEIDLVMRDQDTLVFVEVRARADRRYGGAAASVDRAKRDRLIRSAALLLPRLARQHWQGRTPAVRFDVVAVDGGEMQWLPAAFSL